MFFIFIVKVNSYSSRWAFVYFRNVLKLMVSLLSDIKWSIFSAVHKHFWPLPGLRQIVPPHRIILHSLWNPMICSVTQTHLPLLFYLPLSFTCIHTHTHTHKNRLATVYSSDQNLCDTHTEHNYSFLTSHLSPGPQTLPLGVGQLLSLATNVTVTQVIGTLCSLSGLSPPLLAPPPVKQRKFSQRAINIKWNPV